MVRKDKRAGEPRVCYRYRTAVLTGPWRRLSQRALQDAIESGQARYADGEPQWIVAGQIEESRCDSARAACGGNYPAAD